MGSRNSSSSSSRSSTVETALSKKQAEILGNRESLFRNTMLPELKDMLAESKKPTIKSNIFAQHAATINNASLGASKSFSTQMARRGLSGSGVEAQGLAGLEHGRVSSLSSAYAKAAAAQQDQRNKVVTMGLNMSPRATTAAPMGQVSKSSAVSAGGSILK